MVGQGPAKTVSTSTAALLTLPLRATITIGSSGSRGLDAAIPLTMHLPVEFLTIVLSTLQVTTAVRVAVTVAIPNAAYVGFTIFAILLDATADGGAPLT